jgi:cell division protein FtsL
LHQAKSQAAVRKCAVSTLVVLAGFALCMLYTYQVTRIIAMGYQADNIQNSVSELQQENSQLDLEAAELQTPERVEQIATTKLGMQQPQDFMVASCSIGQVSPQEPQAQAPSTASSWSARLLAAIPRFVGRAEASPQ